MSDLDITKKHEDEMQSILKKRQEDIRKRREDLKKRGFVVTKVKSIRRLVVQISSADEAVDGGSNGRSKNKVIPINESAKSQTP